MFFVEVIRLLVIALCIAAGYWIGRGNGVDTHEAAGAIIGCLVGYVSGGLAGRLLYRAVGSVEEKVEKLPAAHVLAGIAGGACGVIVGAALASPAYVFLPAYVSVPLAGILMATFCSVCYQIFTRKSDELLQMIGLSTHPLIRARPYDHADGFVVDSSAIMDGQLLPLVHAGVLGSDLMVPRFVLDELQGFADAPDIAKSRRAKRGLEILETLRQEGPVRVLVLDQQVPEIADVDSKLVSLAKRLKLRVLTNDANLARSAEVQGVLVSNLRKLATELSPEVLAGDHIQIALTKEGNQEGQGVGYLEDGSMVIVNGGAGLVGQGRSPLVVTSIVPTAMGRIVFARTDTEEVDQKASEHAS